MKKLLPIFLLLICAPAIPAQTKPKLVIVGLPDTLRISEGKDTTLFLDEHIQVEGFYTLDLKDIIWEFDQNTLFPGLRADQNNSNSLTLIAPDDLLDKERKEIPTTIYFTVFHQADDLLSASDSLVVILVSVDDPPRINDSLKSMTMMEDSTSSIDLREFVIDEDTDLKDLDWEVTRQGNIVRADIVNHVLTLRQQENRPDTPGTDGMVIELFEKQSPELRAARDISVRVEPVNDPPIIAEESRDITIRLLENNESNTDVVLVNLKATDADNTSRELTWTVIEGDTTKIKLRFELLREPLGEEVRTLRVQPVPNYFTEEDKPKHYVIQVTDGKSTDEAEVTVHVKMVPDPPSLRFPREGFVVAEDSTLSVMLDNYVIVDPAVEQKKDIRWELASSVRTRGRIDRTQRIATFQPQENWYGVEEVVFRAIGQAGSADTTVRVYVEARPDTPRVIEGKRIELYEDQTASFAAGEIAVDADSTDQLRVRLYPSLLSVKNLVDVEPATIQEGWGIIVTPRPDTSGTTTIRLIVEDQTGLADTGLVEVVVHPINDIPRVIGKTITLNEDSAGEVFSLDEFVEDKDDPVDRMQWEPPKTVTDDRVTAIIDPVRRTITFYTQPNFYGVREIRLAVRDTSKARGVGTVRAVVNNINDPPTFTELLPPVISIQEDQTYILDLSEAANDIDNAPDEFIWNIEPSDTTAIQVRLGRGFANLTPEKDWTGQGRLRVVVLDGAGGRIEKTIEVNVKPINDPPNLEMPSIPFSGGQVFEEGDTLTIDLAQFVDDVDNNGRELSYSCSQSAHIYCRTEETAAILWTSDSQWHGTEIIHFTTRDPGNLQDEQSAVVAVSEVDDCPDITAIPDVTLQEDGVFRFDLDDFVRDPDTPPAAISWEVAKVDSIEVQIDASFHTVTFRPEKDFFGRRDVTFSALGGCGEIKQQPITITVAPVNDPPTLRGISLAFDEEKTLIVRRDSLLFDLDDPVDSLTDSVTSLGKVQVEQQAGNFVLSAPLDYFGKDSIKVTVRDRANLEFTGTLRVIVNGVNDSPEIALPGYLTFFEDADTTIDLDDFLVDVDTPDEQIAWSARSIEDDSVQAIIDSESHVTQIQPAANFHGIRNLTFTAVDGYGIPTHQMAATVQVEVKPVNDPPVIKIQQLSFSEDGSIVVNLDDLVDDVDNPVSQLRWNVQGDRLIEVIPEGRGFRLKAPQDSSGTGQIVVQVFDFEDSTQAEIAIAVGKVNDPPDISQLPVNITFPEDVDPPYTLDLDDYLRDIDTPSSQIRWTAVDPNSAVPVIVDPRPPHRASFRPRANFAGNSEILFTAIDGDYAIPRTSSIHVQEVNDPPVISAQRVEFKEGETESFALREWAQDVDNRFEDLAWKVDVPDVSPLRAQIDGDSLKLSTLDPDYYGTTLLTLGVEDPGHLPASVVVRVDVMAVDDPPVVAAIREQATPEDTQLRFSITPFLKDVDTKIENLSIIWASSSVGSVNIEGKNLIVVPSLNFCNSDTSTGQVSFAVTDREDTVEQSFEVRVSCVNDPPILQVPGLELVEGDTGRYNIRGWVKDNEDDFGRLKWAVEPVQGGILQVRIDGEWLEVSTHDPDAYGEERIKVEVEDSGGLTASSSISVKVIGKNDPPVIAPIPTQQMVEDRSYDLFLRDFITDVDDSLETLTIRASGNMRSEIRGFNLHVVPPSDFCGTDKIFLTVEDPSKTQAHQTIDINVECLNDPPEFRLQQIEMVEDRADTVLVSELVADIDNSYDQLHVELFSSLHVTAKKEANRFILAPEADWNGAETLFAKIEDQEVTVSLPIAVKVDSVFDIILQVPELAEDEEYQTANIYDLLEERRPGEQVFWKGTSSEHIEVKIDNALGTLSIEPKADWFGQEYIGLQALGSEGRSDEIEVPIAVRPLNDTPLINLTQLEIPEDSTITLDLGDWVTDVDDPIADMRCTATGDFFDILQMDESNPCVFQLTPQENQYGAAILKLEVTDPAGAQSTVEVPVAVPPRADEFTFDLDLPQPLVIRENESYTLDLSKYVEGIDTKDEIFTPERLGVITTTTESRIVAARKGWELEISSNDYIGPGEIVVSLFDLARGVEAKDTIAVEFTSYRPPKYTGPPEFSFPEDGELEVWVDTLATDPDNRVQSLDWFITPDKAGPVVVREGTVYRQNDSGKIDTLKIITFSCSQEDWNGSTQVFVIVRDPSGNEDSTQVRIQVLPVNDPPRIKPALADLLRKGVNEDDSLVVVLDENYVWDDAPVERLSWHFEVVEDEKKGDIQISTRPEGTFGGSTAVPRLVLKPKPDWEGSFSLKFWTVDRDTLNATSDTQTVPITVLKLQDAPRINPDFPTVITLGKNRQFTMPLKPFAEDVDGELLTWSAQFSEEPPFDKDSLVIRLNEPVLSISTDSLWGQGGPVTLRLSVSDGGSSVNTPLIQVYSDPSLEFPLTLPLEPIDEDQSSPVKIPGANFPPFTQILVETTPRSLVPPRLVVEGSNTVRPTLSANWFGDMTLLFQVPFTFDTGIPRPYTTVASASLQVESVNDPPNPFDLLQPAVGDTLPNEGDTLPNEFEFSWNATDDPDKEEVQYLVKVALDTLFITGLKEVVATENKIRIKVVEELPQGPARRYYWQVIAQDPVLRGSTAQERFREFFIKGMPSQPVISIDNLRDGFLREPLAQLSWTPFSDPDGDTNEEYRIYVDADSALVAQSSQKALLDRVRPDVNRFTVMRSADGRALAESTPYYLKVETRTVRFRLHVSDMTQFVIDLQKPLAGLTLESPVSGAQILLNSPEDSLQFKWNAAVSPNQNDEVRYHLEWWPLQEAQVDTQRKDVGTLVEFKVPRREFVAAKYGWRVRAESRYGGSLASEIETFEVTMKDMILDLSNYPNPMDFLGETTIDFRLSREADVTVRIFDQSGTLIRILTEGQRFLPPNGEINWNGRDGTGRPVARGVYLCYMQARPVNRKLGEDVAKHWIVVFRR